jgi:hypothetical protein
LASLIFRCRRKRRSSAFNSTSRKSRLRLRTNLASDPPDDGVEKPEDQPTHYASRRLTKSQAGSGA